SPFVRLALARYQPHSIPTLEMSAVTRADFAQLAPERSVTIVTRAAGAFDVVVSGTTHDASANPAVFTGRVGTIVRVSAQARVTGTTDDAGWTEAAWARSQASGRLIATGAQPVWAAPDPAHQRHTIEGRR